MTIKALPLTADAFAPFGQVLEGNQDGAHRREFLAKNFSSRPQARLNTTFMRVAVDKGPTMVKALERHVHSNQFFVPLNGTRHLVAVCPADADGNPDLSRIKVFVASGSQGVNYDPNVWHAPRQPLSAPGEFVMQRWDDGSAADTELRPLPEPIEVTGL